MILEILGYVIHYLFIAGFVLFVVKRQTMHIWYMMDEKEKREFLDKITHQSLFWPWYALKYLFTGLIGLVRRAVR